MIKNDKIFLRIWSKANQKVISTPEKTLIRITNENLY